MAAICGRTTVLALSRRARRRHLAWQREPQPYPTHANSECGASVALPDAVVQRNAWPRLGVAASGSLTPRSPPPGRASRPPFRVCAVPRAGAALQPLRPRSALLRPRLLARGASGLAPRDRAALPAQPCRTACARRTVPAMAPSRVCSSRPWRCDLHQLRDAPGFPARGNRCSTASMRASRRTQAGRHRHQRRTDLPALRRSAVAVGPPGLPAPRPCLALGRSCGRPQPLIKESLR